jgi:hypothetical protein
MWWGYFWGVVREKMGKNEENEGNFQKLRVLRYKRGEYGQKVVR